MINVLFFASLRERLNTEKLELDAANLKTVNEVYEHLVNRSETFKSALEAPKPLMAVNQSIAQPSSPVKDGDEVAFYPPVTGG